MVNVQEKVTAMLVDKLNIESSQVTLTANFIKDLGIDSLDYIELIMEFEQAFNICIPDTEGEQLKTVGQAIDYIEKKLNEPKSIT